MPVAIFLSIWSYDVSLVQIIVEFLIATILSIYVLVLSILSPCPPLYDSKLGSVLSVLSWILLNCIFIRVRCLIATRLEKYGQKTLLLLGALTQVGQIFGGIIAFLCINVYELLRSKPSCIDDFSYCH